MQSIRDSVTVTRRERTSRISLNVTEAVGALTGRQRGGGENVDRFNASGVIQFDTSNLWLTFELPNSGTGAPAPKSAEIRQVDGTYFVEIPGSDRWLKLDPQRLADTLGDPSGLRSAVGTSPNALLDLLAGTEQARRVGAETVRGVETERFSAAVDVAAAARGAKGDARAALERLSTQMAQTALPLEVWLDGAGRVVRLRIPVIVESTPEAPDPPRVTTTMEFFDFGVRAAVDPPPESAVERA